MSTGKRIKIKETDLLRGVLEALHDLVKELIEENKQLRTENAKLKTQCEQLTKNINYYQSLAEKFSGNLLGRVDDILKNKP